jgi:hypothetical protein
VRDKAAIDEGKKSVPVGLPSSMDNQSGTPNVSIVHWRWK